MKQQSHLLQMRGLKLQTQNSTAQDYCRIFYRCVDWNKISNAIISFWCVASFTDAWIDTKEYAKGLCRKTSHLLQMRGLKHPYQKRYQHNSQSHLLQMRGLKHFNCTAQLPISRRIFYRCVDWNSTCVFWASVRCRIFYRCVDWNRIKRIKTLAISCRIFYRCVDWNWY